MSKILITGVAGMIGSRLADWIVANRPEMNVLGIDDLSGGYIENVNPEVEFVNLDLSDSVTRLDEVFDKFEPDIVFHMSAYAAEGLSPFIREFNYRNNLLVTSRIVNMCIKHAVKRLVYTSSMAVYGHGNADQHPFEETDRPSPIDPYGIAKLASEQDIQIAGQQHGLDWCIIRPHNVYGIKQNIWDKYRNVIGIWMYQFLNNQPMTIFGTGEQRRAFSYVDDCIEPLFKAGFGQMASKQIVNLGGSVSYSINEVNCLLRDIIGGGETIYLESRHEVKDAFSSWQKSIDILGYEGKTNLRHGLAKMWAWAKAQPYRTQRLWNGFELDIGIYGFWK